MKKKLLVLYIIFTICTFASASIGTSREPSKTVFITGGAGFIGCNFLKYMFDKYPNYNFIVLDALTYASTKDCIPKYIQESPRFEFIQGSITDTDVVDNIMERSNLVVNFAAETDVTRSIQDDLVFVTSNVLGTRTLLRSLLKYRANVERFIHISSSEVYGTADREPMDEEHPLNPRSPYAATKAGAERLVYSYCCTYDLPVMTIRAFNNYGPNQHIEKMLPRFITSAIKQVPLNIEGSGLQRRDWICTFDVSSAIDRILHIPNFDSIKNQVINIGTGKAISVLEIAKMILKHFNLPEDRYLKFVEDRPGQVDTHISSTEKALKLLNWKTQISFEEGLKNTIQWYIENRSSWDKPELTCYLSTTSPTANAK